MENKTEVDIVICSFAKNDELLEVTKLGLRTLVDSEDDIKFNIFVVETNQEVNYDDFPTRHHTIKTLYTDEPFGYHTYLNVGLEHCKSEWSCLCNNDLEFTKYWATILVKTCQQAPNTMISASPCNPKEPWHNQHKDTLAMGFTVREHIAGWCLFQHRDVLKKIGKLDERIKFWFADNYYSVMLQHHKIPHLFVGNSIVWHHENVEGTTTKQVDWDDKTRHNMTFGAGDEFREIIREKLGDPNWGVVSEQQKEAMKQQGRNYY